MEAVHYVFHVHLVQRKKYANDIPGNKITELRK